MPETRDPQAVIAAAEQAGLSNPRLRWALIHEFIVYVAGGMECDNSPIAGPRCRRLVPHCLRNDMPTVL